MKLFKIIFLCILCSIVSGSISASSEAIDLNKIASMNSSTTSLAVSDEIDFAQVGLSSTHLSQEINSVGVEWFCLPFPFNFICFPIFYYS